jgi:hypothetical protein
VQFLSLSIRRTDRFAEAAFAELVDAEASRARELYAAGFIRQIWHRGDLPGACMVLEAASLDEARARLHTLPMIGAGMLEVSIVPLVPYAGFVAGPRPRQPVATEREP